MSVSVSQYKNELLNEIEGLSVDKLKQILDFVCFIKAKDLMDPSQSYFWTKQWQQMENNADNDKKTENIIGDGTLHNLLNELK
ncbi:MAG: hypothetical protein V2I97_17450 [Desulfococcaceae bacterium]|jgi:hypothetical protein|nr:hypothetical protein [Desulfococcaceae bacterium]